MAESKEKEFLDEYAKLVAKYGLFVGSCGCCNSPWIANLEDADEDPIKHLSE